MQIVLRRFSPHSQILKAQGITGAHGGFTRWFTTGHWPPKIREGDNINL